MAEGERLRHIVEEIDYVAAYLIALDLWYIIPAGVVAMRKGNIWLAPWRRQSKYERYLEAWHLLRRWRGETYPRKEGKKQKVGGGSRGRGEGADRLLRLRSRLSSERVEFVQDVDGSQDQGSGIRVVVSLPAVANKTVELRSMDSRGRLSPHEDLCNMRIFRT